MKPLLLEFAGTQGEYESHEETPVRPKAYRLHVLISKEDDEDQYSIVALNLPGCVSCGDTVEEAKKNIKEAATGLIEAYETSGKPIPWKDTFSQDILGSEVVLLYA